MQGSDNFRLIVRRGPQPNQVYELSKDIVTLGRDITNDIVINDPEASRHHLRLTRGAGGFTLEDLGSTNGTFVNGQRLTGARPLRQGDMIGLGETVTLAYEAASAGASVGGAEAPGVTAPNAVQRAPASPPPQAAYSPVSPPPYSSGGYEQQPSYSAPQQAPAIQPPGAGYDYDPYAVREEEPQNTTRLILIGCGVLSLLCCCGTIGGAVLVDQLCLWDRIPIVWNILSALGLSLSSGCV
ncbi:MAG: FHA domain-containing protein [Anaerolineae bacterium]|nr:FHA domain-containing protein [Anaerolineae bacterium]